MASKATDYISSTEGLKILKLWKECGCNVTLLAERLGKSPTSTRRTLKSACWVCGFTVQDFRAQHTSPKTAEVDVVKAWEDHGRVSDAASRFLGMPRSTFREKLRKALAASGKSVQVLSPAPMADGMTFRKSTVQYDAEGRVVNEWRRLGTVADDLEAVSDSLIKIADARAHKLPALPAPPKVVADDLLLEIPLFDRHFGMYAWGKETGADFNLDVAYRLVVGQTECLASRVGAVGKALIVIGGDWFHSDTRHNRTERGDNPLDVDTRQGKVWDVATKALVDSVSIAGKYARHVDIVVIPGNHDWESSYHFGRLLAAWYRQDPRVTVIHGPTSRHYYQHGSVLLGFAHGHLLKMHNLAGLMADEVPDKWAATRTRAWHLGHIHHTKRLSYMSAASDRSVEVEYLETTTSPDAWHTEQGFVGSPRRGISFTWSATSGLVARNYVNAKDIIKS